MTDKEIEQKLKNAIERTAPDGLGRLLSEIDNGKGDVKMDKTSVNKKKNRWLGGIAACLAVAILAGFGGYSYAANYSVATTVSLDVNPSIQMEVNRSEKILTCAGLNAEGREILSSMNGGEDLKGAKLNVAVNAIVGAIVRAGYLDSLGSAILISVEDDNEARGERLQAQLVAEVDGVLKGAANSAGVLSQNMTSDKNLDKQAQENNISSGKAALVNEVLALNPALEFEKLAALSVEELRDLIRIGAPAMPIGKDEAARVVAEYSGIQYLDSVVDPVFDVDPELDEPTPHYEVELSWGRGSFEYDYRVDAFTGEILYGENISDPGTGTTTPTPSGPAVTADEAFNAAAEYFSQKHPELTGNFLNIETSYDRDDGHYDVEFWCMGYEFDYEVDGETGAVLREETDYRYTPPTQPENPPAPSEPTPSTPADIGADDAKSAALQRAGIADASSVTWIKCQREYDDGRLEYDIEFVSGATEYDVTVDAASGSILKYETENRPSSSTPSTPTDIGADAAKAAALSHAGLSEGQVTRLKCERDYDDGRLVYEVEFKSNGWEYEYKIDAATGAVLEHDRDFDD